MAKAMVLWLLLKNTDVDSSLITYSSRLPWRTYKKAFTPAISTLLAASYSYSLPVLPRIIQSAFLKGVA